MAGRNASHKLLRTHDERRCNEFGVVVAVRWPNSLSGFLTKWKLVERFPLGMNDYFLGTLVKSPTLRTNALSHPISKKSLHSVLFTFCSISIYNLPKSCSPQLLLVWLYLAWCFSTVTANTAVSIHSNPYTCIQCYNIAPLFPHRQNRWSVSESV